METPNGKYPIITTQPPSYKDALAGTSTPVTNPTTATLDYLDSSTDEEPEFEDPTCPVIRLTRAEKTEIRTPWRQSLIIKVMWRIVPYSYLRKRLLTIWKPKSELHLVEINNDYFVARFASAEDYNYAKLQGPWTVMGHHLIVKNWVPNFDPYTDWL